MRNSASASFESGDETFDLNSNDVSSPPDGGYGWVCVLGQFFINGFTWGVVAVRCQRAKNLLN